MIEESVGRSDDLVSAWSAQLYGRRMRTQAARHLPLLGVADKAFVSRRFADARNLYFNLLQDGLTDGDAACRLLHCVDWLADWDMRNQIRDRVIDLVRSEARRDGFPGTEPLAFLSLELDPVTLFAVSRVRAAGLFPRTPQTGGGIGPQRRRMRVGYLSSDFRSHSSGGHLGPLLAAHDRDLVEVVAYGLGAGEPPPDAVAADRYVALGNHTIATALEVLEREAPDVLIDTTRHLRNGAAWLANRRLAPLQISAWGYGGSSGSASMDLLLTDPVLSGGSRATDAIEAVREIVCYLAVEPLKPGLATSLSPVLRRNGNHKNGRNGGALVLGAMCSPYKIDSAVFGAWLDILAAVPEAVLWLADGPEGFADRLRRVAQHSGIAASRLIFLPTVPPAAHLARLSRIDLFLDNSRLGGGRGVFDALACGRPVLAWPGGDMRDRSAASLLHAVGLDALVPSDVPAYTRQAIVFCRDEAMRTRWEEATASAKGVGPEPIVRALEELFREWFEL